MTAPAQPAAVAGITDTEQFWFMPAFLADALNSFTGDTVTLHTQTNPTRPVLFTDTPDGPTDGRTFCHLLMPVHPPRN